jgi:two-component system chemotaxis response regulator CheB
VFVVVHTAPYVPSRLADVLRRAGPLDAVAATNGAPLELGKIVVAPPDEHLLIEPGRVRLAHGPKENRARPAIDPLFRSAALHYGPRVLGVILSGALDDGTPGLWVVKDRGGIAIVQDPADALLPSMPTSALSNVAVDHVVPAHEIAPLLTTLVRVPVESRTIPVPLGDTNDLVREIAIATVDEDAHWNTERYGVPSRFGCPDCGGVLWTSNVDGPLMMRCEVGHGYSAAALAEEQTDAVERALWAAVRALEDKAELAALRAAGARDNGHDDVVRRLMVQREATHAHAAAIRALLRLDGRSGMQPNERPDTEPFADRPASGESGSGRPAQYADRSENEHG